MSSASPNAEPARGLDLVAGPPSGPGGELLRILRLAWPVVVTQLASMMLGVVDALMVGRVVGVEALAAATLGNAWVVATLMAAMGLVLGMDPLVSQAHGARDARGLGLATQSGVAMALLVSVPTMLVLLFTERGLLLLGQDPALAAAAHEYTLVQIPGVPFFLFFIALRQTLQGREIVMPAMVVALAANLVNAGANWLLIEGHLGAPALGLVGSGVATSATRAFLFLALLGWILAFGLHRGAWGGWSWEAFSPARLLALLGVGVPVALQFGLEVWAFQASTFLAGRLGQDALAAHAIVLNLASISFMVPLGISIATAARVGNLIGAGRPLEAQRAAWVSMGLGALVMGGAAIVFVGGRALLPSAYTDDAQVLALAALLLPIAAGFQLFDGLQVVGCGVLRGMGRTLPAALFNLLGYYGLGLPIGALLAFELGFGVSGVWFGLLIGLATVAFCLMGWIAIRGPRRSGARLRIEPASS